MSEYMHLIGSEQVQNAGHTMRDAAREMLQAAGTIDDSVRRLAGLIDDLRVILADDREQRAAAWAAQNAPARKEME